jgi:hypothetical protein
MNGVVRPRIRFGDPTISKDLAAMPRHAHHGGEGVLETVSVDRIDPDPENARFLGRLSPQEIRDHREGRVNLANDPSDDRRGFFEALQGLAESIEQQGLLQPVVVAPFNGRYRLIAGERRYLAHLLLGRESIRSVVRPNPGDLQAMALWSLAENLQREDLRLPEILEVVERLGSLLEKQHGRAPTWADFHGLLHKSKRQCGRYAAMYRASPELKAKIRAGEIQTMHAMDEVMAQPRDDGEGQRTVASGPMPMAASSRSAAWSLGRIRSTQALSVIIQSALDHSTVKPSDRAAFADVDWNDPEDVKKAWKRLIDVMEALFDEA